MTLELVLIGIAAWCLLAALPVLMLRIASRSDARHDELVAIVRSSRPVARRRPPLGLRPEQRRPLSGLRI